MSAKPTPTPANDAALGKLLESCRELCEGARTSLTELPTTSQEFLATNLQDALAHLELILRVLDKETGRTKEPQGSRRRTRGQGRRPKDAPSGSAVELPELFSVSQHGLQGNSWTIPLPELIGFLAYGRKTGVLWVDSAEESFLLGLEEGRLVHATSDATPAGLRLGEVMVTLGFLTRRQLDRFLAAIDGQGKHLTGEKLIEAGMIDAQELQAALTYQVQQLFNRLIETRNAIFKFREGMQVALAYHVELNVPTLLLESARECDERSSDRTLEASAGALAASEKREPGAAEPAPRKDAGKRG